MKKRNVGIIVGLIAVAAIIFFVWPRDAQNETMEVETTTVTQGDFREVIRTVGIIEPVETETFVGQGPVSEVHVEMNEEVAEEDVLVSYLDGTEFVAPFDGTVVTLNVEEEEVDANAQQNQPSLVLANLEDLQVGIELSKSEANDVEVDQEAELMYLDTTYGGTVTHVDAIASTGQGGGSPLQSGQSSPALEATVSFNEDEETSELIPGFDIDVEVIVATTTDSLAIPIESLLYNEESQPYVFVVENGVAQAREIETGIQEGVMIEVVSGLEANEEVVQLPNEDLTDGTEVTVVDSEDDAREE